MIVDLVPHPTTPCPAVTRLSVEVWRTAPTRLHLRYVVEGEIDLIVWPKPAEPRRTDDLWRHTCLEAFVAGPGEGYREFNFTTSTAWAAYDFESYRAGMRPARVEPPDVQLDRAAAMLALEAMASIPAEALQLALSAVIEAADGQVAYWSLAHPPGKPDFHHADCFRLDLPAPDRG